MTNTQISSFVPSSDAQQGFEGREMQLTETSEQALISRCQRGDTNALGQLYQRYKDRVYAVALRLCQQPSDAEDILQEVFVNVHKNINAFRGDAAFSTWLHRMTVNATRSHARKHKKSRHDRQVDEAKDELPQKSSTGDPVARKRLLRAMAALPEGYREILVLHDIQGLRHREIADILDIQPGTSKSQLSKARSRMRVLLKEQRS